MDYVAGFMFSFDNERVALVKKDKPTWQFGMLNGIGGKIEEGETPNEAMVREFKEETGYDTTEGQWRLFCGLKYNDGLIYFYTTHGNLDNLRTMESEEIAAYNISDLRDLNVVPNLHWLIPIASDRKIFAMVEHEHE